MAADKDTIVAIATPSGRGGIGIVRMSGQDLQGAVEELLGSVPEPNKATKAIFSDAEGNPIDDGLALFFRAPRSYTGEDVLELHGHGNPVVLRMLVRRCIQLGARIAEPGEFTRRAFEHDRIDLAQAESVADLIDAATEQAARSAIRSLRGEFSALIRGFERDLVELRMLVEAGLDFPDEELGDESYNDMKQRVSLLAEALAQALASSRRGSLLRSGLNVVLAGQPNSGKSSLLNRLAGDDLAIVTPHAGTTRDPIRETLNIEGIPLNIVDTAGLREADEEIEILGIQRSWRAIGEADLVLLLVDSTAGVTDADQSILDRIPEKTPRFVVLNKIDLTGELPRRCRTAMGDVIHLSAKTGAGLDNLRRALLEVAGWQGPDESVFSARQRHVVALERALEAVRRAAGQLSNSELFAEELRLAHESLGTILGEFLPDDLLGEIFSRFCIGK